MSCKTRAVRLLFSLICLSIFLYQSYLCLQNYLRQDTVTKVSQERQTNYPFPVICLENLFAISRLSKEKLDNLNITAADYRKNGIWKSKNYSEEETYNFLSYDLTDLVEEIKVYKNTDDNSDRYIKQRYKTIDFPWNISVTSTRCDYYYSLKCFCIEFSSVEFREGFKKF